jgi:phosphomannomutase
VISDQLRVEVQEWIDNDPDKETAKQLSDWLKEGNSKELDRCFSGFLQFGTAGLRGPIGPGPSCMNRAVVSRTATGIVEFMKKNHLTSVVIGRDARHGSDQFSQDSAEIFSGAGIKTYVLPRALPTPVLAFAINKLKVDVGIMVTASHNPATDNGYKVYLGGVVAGVNYRGSQIISPVDTEISNLIAKANKNPPRSQDFQTVNESVIDDYISSVAALSTTENNLKVVYTPLHGVGAETFIEVFKRAKFALPILVSEQVNPDPYFPTTPFPNPEEPGSMDMALNYAKTNNADVVIANDPDADRCAMAIVNPDGLWQVLRGDELGVLIGDYLIKKSPSSNKAIANSLVSSSLLGKIANKHGLKFEETLTGFKWISKIDNLLFGYEEALGYCVDQKNVNDKDGISAALILVQIVNELKISGQSIFDYLEKLGNEYGFHRTDQISIRVTNLQDIDEMLKRVIAAPPKMLIDNSLESYENLSESKVMSTVGIRLNYENGIRVIIRPSGTEPKLKCYIEVVSSTKNEAENLISQIKQALTKVLS